VGWLLFRADSFGVAASMLARMATSLSATPWVWSALAYMAFLAVPLLAFERAALRGERRLEWLLRGSALVRGGAYAYMAVMILLFHAGEPVEFIYFQF
jgi:hypothetical protein